jgi:predicted metalloprotease
VVAALLAGCSASTSGAPVSSSATAPVAPTSSTATPVASSSAGALPPATASPTSAPTVRVAPASCPHRYTATALATCIATATRVYLATWTKDLAAVGITNVKPPRIVVFAMIPKNPCISNEGDAAEASFFCSKNNTLYVSGTAAKTWTVYYAKAAAARKVLASDAKSAGTTVADLRSGYPLVGATTELAHELGHWAQKVSGQLAWYDARTASSNFTVSNGAQATGEGAADCMAGWVQGRTARDGTWVDTRIGRWAHHATMAELGFDIDSVKAGFTFPKEKPADIIGYGNSYTRLKFYDVGYAAGHAGKHGLSTCSRYVATYLKAPLPPHS